MFLRLAGSSSWVVITALLAPIAVVRLQVVRLGVAIQGALSQLWSGYQSPETTLLKCVGEWPAIPLAQVKAGVSILSRLLNVAVKGHHVRRPHQRRPDL